MGSTPRIERTSWFGWTRTDGRGERARDRRKPGGRVRMDAESEALPENAEIEIDDNFNWL